MNRPSGVTFAEIRTRFAPPFDLETFRNVFVKASWKVYTELHPRPVPADRFKATVEPLFDALFERDEHVAEQRIDDLRDLFDPASFENVPLLLADTFYLVLNHFVRLQYGTLEGWEKIIEFTSAIQTFVHGAAERIDSEAIYLFDDILIETLDAMRESNRPVTLLNTYLGIPIQYPASIVHTDEGSVTLKPHPLQVTAALIQKGVYLLHDERFPFDVFADVRAVEIHGQSHLKLSRFDRLQSSLTHRQNIRVQPARPLTAGVVHQGNEHRCRILDLSLGGIALTARPLYPIPVDAEVILHFPADIALEEPEVRAKLIYRSAYEGGHKYHFTIDPTLQQESDLSRYIVQREKEIIRQLRDEIL